MTHKKEFQVRIERNDTLEDVLCFDNHKRAAEVFLAHTVRITGDEHRGTADYRLELVEVLDQVLIDQYEEP